MSGLVAAGLFLALSVLSFQYAEYKRASANAGLSDVASVGAESMALQDEVNSLQAEDVDATITTEEPEDLPEVKAPAQEKTETVKKEETVTIQQPKPVSQSTAAKVTKEVKQQEVLKPVVKVASRGTSTVASKKAGSVVSTAKQYLGRPYVYGASGPEAFDCSGLTMYVFAKFGVSLPHSANAQSQMGQFVAKDKLQQGDLVFFTTNGKGTVSHVGIYTGGGSFIHAPETGKSVRIESMSGSYYSARYITARRVIQ